MSDLRESALYLGLMSASITLVLLGAWLFKSHAPPAPEVVYSSASITALYWLGYFGWRS